MDTNGSVRRSLYVLFARLLAGPPDAELYTRLRAGGFLRFADAQEVDLTSDLLDPDDADATASELQAEYGRLQDRVSLRASDYAGATADPVVALEGFLAEHGLEIDAAGLPADHLSIALGVMGQLADRGDAGDARLREQAFFRRHLQPWAAQALTEWATAADRQFCRGLAVMLSAFLESERRLLGSA